MSPLAPADPEGGRTMPPLPCLLPAPEDRDALPHEEDVNTVHARQGSPTADQRPRSSPPQRPPLDRLSSSSASSGPPSSSSHAPSSQTSNSQQTHSNSASSRFLTTPDSTPNLNLPKGASGSQRRPGPRPAQSTPGGEFDPLTLLPPTSHSFASTSTSSSTSPPAPAPAVGLPTSVSLPFLASPRRRLKKPSPPSAWSPHLPTSQSTPSSANSSTTALSLSLHSLSVPSRSHSHSRPPALPPNTAGPTQGHGLNRSPSFGKSVVKLVRSLSWKSMKRSPSGRDLTSEMTDHGPVPVPPLPTSSSTPNTSTTATSSIPASATPTGADLTRRGSISSLSSSSHAPGWGWESRLSSQRARPPAPRGAPPGIEESYARLVGDAVAVVPMQAVAGPSTVRGIGMGEDAEEEEEEDALYMRTRASHSPPPAYTPSPRTPTQHPSHHSPHTPTHAPTPPDTSPTRSLAHRLSRPNLQSLPFTFAANTRMPEVLAPGGMAALTGQAQRRRSVRGLVMREQGGGGGGRRRAGSGVGVAAGDVVGVGYGENTAGGSRSVRRKTLGSVESAKGKAPALQEGVRGQGRGHTRSKSASLDSNAGEWRDGRAVEEGSREWTEGRKRSRSRSLVERDGAALARVRDGSIRGHGEGTGEGSGRDLPRGAAAGPGPGSRFSQLVQGGAIPGSPSWAEELRERGGERQVAAEKKSEETLRRRAQGHARKGSAPPGLEGMRVDADLARDREGSVRTARSVRSAGSGSGSSLRTERQRANTVGELPTNGQETQAAPRSLAQVLSPLPLLVSASTNTERPLPELPLPLPPPTSPRKSRFTIPGLTPFPPQAPMTPVPEVVTPGSTSPLKRASLSSKSLPDALRRAFSFRSATPVPGAEEREREREREVPPVPPLPAGSWKGQKRESKEVKEKEGIGALPAKALRRRSSSIHVKKKSDATAAAAAAAAAAATVAAAASGSSGMQGEPRLRRASTMFPSPTLGIPRLASPPPPVPDLPPALTSPIKSAKKLFRRPRTFSNPKTPSSAASSVLSPISASSLSNGHPRPPLPIHSHTIPPPVPSLPLPSHLVPKPLPKDPPTAKSSIVGGRVDLHALAFTGFAARPSTDHGHSYSSPSSSYSASPPPSPSLDEHGEDAPRRRPRMIRGTSDLRRWTLADFPDDVSFLRAIGQKAKSDIGHMSEEAVADGEATVEGYVDEEDWWVYKEPGEGDAGRALLCVREIVRTEESYRRRLEAMYASAQPLPQAFLSHLPALILASSRLSRRLADDPSAWGAATALLGCEDEMERALVSWSAVVGDVIWGVSRSKKSKKGWSEDVREVAVMPTQRVPRYVLMYRELLHFTPPSSPSRPLVERALEGALRIAARCDAAQRHVDSALPPSATSTQGPSVSFMNLPPLSTTSNGSDVYTQSSPVSPMLGQGIFTNMPAISVPSSKKKIRPKSMGPSARPFTLLTA
ncbi:hypothetical protein CALVIDRAFT_113392 [Calocera viscosa TUFC12733]|uniref:DH domain-containing protein n=1 Tax=Calocera viscosa (strain TUFC12733) TaxID=1330018 RepID=A0A167M4U0_CALVF|nr:hypothetical protein CALVIDRAFT_113392 [Calocera viscosa TUFC12733]